MRTGPERVVGDNPCLQLSRIGFLRAHVFEEKMALHGSRVKTRA
jgi:hypothetical protein